MAKLKEDTIYTSGQKPKSSILNSTFVQRLNSLFGYRTVGKGVTPENEIEKNYGLKFVRVDLNNPQYKVHAAALGNIFKSKNLSQNLEKYFDAYLGETTTSYSDIQDRQARCNELSYMYYNDVFISRCVHLVADEATQLDVQDRLINIESPNAAFVEKTYELLNRWGITQQRVHAACFDIELYGEAFWAHKVGYNGIEKIKPMPVTSIMERLEFSPTQMAKYLSERDGWQQANKDRGSKIKKLVDLLNSNASLDEAENLSDMFDDKLLGYELHDGLIAPPWLITHFRFNADHSEFYPYGRPPLLAALAPFKQAYATMALQGLARSMAFPVTVYKVKATDGLLPAQAFDIVNTVREQYDNLGVAAATEGSEVYTVNTKMWVPEGLVEVETVKSESDFDYIEDLENYQDRVAIAAGVPKGYVDPTEETFGQSGISLMEQYKPFARHVYSVQSTFLQGLGELIRMHYAITGEFDYNTQFILSMRFPAEENSEEKRNAQQATMDLSTSIIELIQKVLGISEDEPLPEDVVTDILSKYSFLDPTDIQKWMRLSAFLKSSAGGDDEDGGDDDMGIDDFGGDMDMGGGDDMGGDDGGMALEGLSANERAAILKRKQLLHERKVRLIKQREARLKSIRERYNNQKDDIYMQFVESNHLTEWSRGHGKNGGKHCIYVQKIDDNNPSYTAYQMLYDEAKNGASNPQGYDRIKEAKEINSIAKMIKSKVDNEPAGTNDRKIQNMIQEAAQNSMMGEVKL